jgi:hypothetical protein
VDWESLTLEYYTGEDNTRASMAPIPYWLTKDQAELLTSEMDDFISTEF